MGEGDGNGMIQGLPSPGPVYNLAENGGETLMFWVDLSAANMIPGNFTAASATAGSSMSPLSAYFPQAAVSPSDTYVFVYYGGNGYYAPSGNYFGVEAISYISYYPYMNGPNYGMTPSQAYAIDAKIDDGLPLSGSVTALIVRSGGLVWSPAAPLNYGYTITTTPGGYYPPYYGSASIRGSCFDNGNVNWVYPMNYSIDQAGSNCGLSFLMQGAAR